MSNASSEGKGAEFEAISDHNLSEDLDQREIEEMQEKEKGGQGIGKQATLTHEEVKGLEEEFNIKHQQSDRSLLNSSSPQSIEGTMYIQPIFHPDQLFRETNLQRLQRQNQEKDLLIHEKEIFCQGLEKTISNLQMDVRRYLTQKQDMKTEIQTYKEQSKLTRDQYEIKYQALAQRENEMLRKLEDLKKKQEEMQKQEEVYQSLRKELTDEKQQFTSTQSKFKEAYLQSANHVAAVIDELGQTFKADQTIHSLKSELEENHNDLEKSFAFNTYLTKSIDIIISKMKEQVSSLKTQHQKQIKEIFLSNIQWFLNANTFQNKEEEDDLAVNIGQLGIDEEYAREIGVEADNLLNEIRNKEHNRMQANQQIVKLKGQINEVYERSRQLIDELNSKIGLSRKEEKGASKINPLFNTHEDFLAYLDQSLNLMQSTMNQRYESKQNQLQTTKQHYQRHILENYSVFTASISDKLAKFREDQSYTYIINRVNNEVKEERSCVENARAFESYLKESLDAVFQVIQIKDKTALEESIYMRNWFDSQLVKHIDLHKAEIDKANTEHLSFIEDLKQSAKQQFDSELAKLHSEYQKFKKDVDEATAEEKKFSQESNQNIIQLEYEIARLNNQLNSANGQVISLTYQLSEQKTQTSFKQTQIDNLQSQLADLKQTCQNGLTKFTQLETMMKQQNVKFLHELNQNSEAEMERKKQESQDAQYIQNNRASQEKKRLTEEIRRLDADLKKQREIEGLLKDDFKLKKQSYEEKENAEQQFRKNFHSQANKVVQNILVSSSKTSINQNSILQEELSKINSQLIESNQRSQQLAESYSKLDLAYNTLHQISSCLTQKCEEVTQLHNLSELTVQKYQSEVNRVRKILQQRQLQFKNDKEALVSSLEATITTLLNESAVFYENLIRSKEEQFQSEIFNLTTELETSRAMKGFKGELVSLNQRRLSKKIEDLQEIHRKKEKKSAQMINTKELSIIELSESLTALKERLEKHQQSERTKEQIINQLQSERELLNKTVNHIHLNLQTKKLKKIIEELDQSQQTLHFQLISLVSCISYQQSESEIEIDRLSLQLRNKTEEYNKLLQSIFQTETKAAENDLMLKQMSEKINIIKSLEKQIANLASDKQLVAKERSSFRASLQNKEKALKQSLDKLKDLQSEIQRLTASNTELQRAKRETERIIDTKENQFNSKLKALQKQNQQNMKMYAKNQEQSKKVIELTKKASNLEIQLSRKESIIQNLVREKSLLEKRANDLKAESEKLQKQVQQLNMKRPDPNQSNYLQRIQELEQKVKQLQAQNRGLENNLIQSHRQIQDLESQLKNSPSKESPKLQEYVLKLRQSEDQIRRLQTSLHESRQVISTLEQQMADLKKKPYVEETTPLSNKKSFNEEQGLLQGYEKIIQNLRETNKLNEEEIEGLKNKIRRLEGQIARFKNKISPSKQAELIQQRLQMRNQLSPKKPEILQQQQEQIVKIRYFGATCLLDVRESDSQFLVKKIQQLYSSKKVMQTHLIYKLSQANKSYSFPTLLPKIELQTECFVLLFATKTNKFGVVSYRKDQASKQSAMIFSITNKKTVTKRQGADTTITQAVSIDYNGDLVISSSHLKMKSSGKILMIKQVLTKYFEQYDKKEIYGSEYWRDDLTVDLSEFQVHRVFLK